MKSDGSGKKKISNLDGDIISYGLSPDGNSVWFAMDVKITQTVKEKYPDLPLITGRIYDDLMYMHWDEWQDEKWSHIFYASIENDEMGEATDIMLDEPYDTHMKPFDGGENIAWSNAGKYIAYTCKKLSGKDYATSTNSDIYLYNISSKRTKNISISNKGYDKNPVFSHNGKLSYLNK